MQYVTHHFAHPETLTLARRWLVQLGYGPGQIETHTDGIPRIAVAVRPGQVAEVEMIINAAELSDPDAWPSFWDVARQDHVYPAAVEESPEVPIRHARTTAIGWHPEERGNAESVGLTRVLDVTTRFE